MTGRRISCPYSLGPEWLPQYCFEPGCPMKAKINDIFNNEETNSDSIAQQFQVREEKGQGKKSKRGVALGFGKEGKNRAARKRLGSGKQRDRRRKGGTLTL